MSAATYRPPLVRLNRWQARAAAAFAGHGCERARQSRTAAPASNSAAVEKTRLLRSESHTSCGNAETSENRCPFCAGRPQLAFLRAEPGAEGGNRHLLCATCLTVWPFRRVVCAHCGEERPAKLGWFHAPEFDHVRIEACDTCRHYLKGVDLTRLGLAVPLVDEIAAVALM